jgi:hypothetical protein
VERRSRQEQGTGEPSRKQPTRDIFLLCIIFNLFIFREKTGRTWLI